VAFYVAICFNLEYVAKYKLWGFNFEISDLNILMPFAGNDVKYKG